MHTIHIQIIIIARSSLIGTNSTKVKVVKQGLTPSDKINLPALTFITSNTRRSLHLMLKAMDIKLNNSMEGSSRIVSTRTRIIPTINRDSSLYRTISNRIITSKITIACLSKMMTLALTKANHN